MPYKIHTHLDIPAPAEEIWNCLIDFPQYPRWSRFIQKIQGQAAPQAQLVVDLDGMRFKPKVKDYEPTRHFSWLGHLLIPGIFDGAHHFKLEALQGGGTRFVHYEQFSGLMLPFLKKKLAREMVSHFDAFNQALAREVARRKEG